MGTTPIFNVQRFNSIVLERAIQPGTHVGGHMIAQRRQRQGLPPLYKTPDTGFIAKIVLNCPWDDPNLRNKKYTFLITPQGGISFKGTFNFTFEPKMKWANLITSWLQGESPSYRTQQRTKVLKMELLTNVLRSICA